MESSVETAHRYVADPQDIIQKLCFAEDLIYSSKEQDVNVVYSRYPRKVMICSSKQGDAIQKAREEVVKHIKETYDCIVVIHDRLLPSIEAEAEKLWGEIHNMYTKPTMLTDKDNETDVSVAYGEINTDDVDLIIVIGGDGTILKIIKMFTNAIPPVIGLSMGSMGYMVKFNMDELKETLSNISTAGLRVSRRRMLHVEIYSDTGVLIARRNALNECVIDRGLSPCISTLDVYYNGTYFTTVTGDGALISTPSGSTAYSMSAGGPIVHPSVSSMLFTVICPHSISYRPVVLPYDAVLDILVPADNRGYARLSVDGNYHCTLKQGCYVRVYSSKVAFPLVLPNNTQAGEEWIRALREHLHWNYRVRQQTLGLEHPLQ